MTHDGKPELAYECQVAEGVHDANIRRLGVALRELGMPVLARIGYEFNGSWNGYRPASYVAAFRRVVSLLREERAPVAAAWCASLMGRTQDPTLMDFYPGDAWVDWWAADIFVPHELSHPDLRRLLEGAEAARKPFLIGESTPRSVGVHGGNESWAAWYEPYFALIRSSPGIKAFSYINWDWSRFPQWSDWGDGRVQGNAAVLARYREEMASPLYQHAGQAPIRR
jgi:hypothetical protein